jgi:hypothetical protein
LIQHLRRRFASCALALTILQAAVACAAPLATCCPSRAASVQADDECCPAGAHPPGECPRHAASKRTRSASCGLQCDAPHSGAYLFVSIGILPPAAVALPPVLDPQRLTPASAVPVFRSLIPDSPPPRLL